MHIYTLVRKLSKAQQELVEKLGPQAKVAYQGLQKAGDGSTCADVAAKCKFETKQDPKRVVGFYFADFVASGLVKQEKVEKPAVEKKAAKKPAKKKA